MCINSIIAGFKKELRQHENKCLLGKTDQAKIEKTFDLILGNLHFDRV